MDQYRNGDQQRSRIGEVIPITGLTQRSNMYLLIKDYTLVRIIINYMSVM